MAATAFVKHIAYWHINKNKQLKAAFVPFIHPTQMSGLPATSVVDCSQFHCRCFSGLLPRPPSDSAPSYEPVSSGSSLHPYDYSQDSLTLQTHVLKTVQIPVDSCATQLFLSLHIQSFPGGPHPCAHY